LFWIGVPGCRKSTRGNTGARLIKNCSETLLAFAEHRLLSLQFFDGTVALSGGVPLPPSLHTEVNHGKADQVYIMDEDGSHS
jgi:hypothetical protein